MRYALAVFLLLGFTALAHANGYDKGREAFEKKDYEAAFIAWQPVAENGGMFAQHGLGYLYTAGFGVARDYGKAARWYEKAAKQGYGGAQYNLGVMFRNGEGVTKDEAMAYMWLHIAALGGHGEAGDEIAELQGKLDAGQRARAEADAVRCFKSNYRYCPEIKIVSGTENDSGATPASSPILTRRFFDPGSHHTGMTVDRIRVADPACPGGEREAVRISGGIILKAASAAESMILSLPDCNGRKVYLNSPGGLMGGGIDLGEFFRKHAIHTEVGAGDGCGSACAVAFLGGRKRSLAGDATLGFHQPFRVASITESKAECDPRAANYLRIYIKRMIGPGAASNTVAAKAMRYCGFDAFWEVTATEAIELGIITE